MKTSYNQGHSRKVNELQEILQVVEQEKKELAMEYLALKSNYSSLCAQIKVNSLSPLTQQLFYKIPQYLRAMYSLEKQKSKQKEKKRKFDHKM